MTFKLGNTCKVVRTVPDITFNVTLHYLYHIMQAIINEESYLEKRGRINEKKTEKYNMNI